MNTRERNLLLMEEDGLDCSQQAGELGARLKESALYRESLERLAHASQLAPTPRLVETYTTCRDLHFDCASMADYAALEGDVFTFALRSMPQWWINPLNPSDEARGKLNSVGQLFADDVGTHTVDSLIEDPDLALADKLFTLGERVRLWHREMACYTGEILSAYRTARTPHQGGKSFTFYLRCALLVLANIYVFCLFLIPSNEVIQAFFHPVINSFETWALYVPLVATGLFDITFILYTLITMNRDRAADYAKKFADMRSKRFVKHLEEATSKLLHDLTQAAENGLPMPANSLSAYARSLKADLDLEALNEEQKRRDKNPLTFLRALYLFTAWLCLFAVLFSIVTLIIMSLGGLFA